MKNLYHNSAKGTPKFIWEKFRESRGEHEQVSDGKEKMKDKVREELASLADEIDVDKITALIDEDTPNEKFVKRANETMILKDRDNNEKIKLTKNKLKIKTDQGVFKVDLKDDVVEKGEELFKKELEVDPEIIKLMEAEERDEELEDSSDLAVDPKVIELMDQEDTEAEEVDTNLENKEDQEKVSRENAAKESKKAYQDAKNKIGAIVYEDLSIENYEGCSQELFIAREALDIAQDKCKGHPEESLLAPLEKELNKKEQKAELMGAAAEKNEEIKKEYKEKTEAQFDKMQKEIDSEVADYQKSLDEIERNPENLSVSGFVADPPNPTTITEIQTGVQNHRIASQKLLAEVNFLQECAGELATKVAKFEEAKSELSFANVGKFALSSLLILPGAVADMGAKVVGSKWRTSDLLPESGAEELNKEQEKFQSIFDTKTAQLDAKKANLDNYGAVLSANSENLKNNKPTEVKEGIREGIESNLPEGVDPSVSPWKEEVEKLVAKTEKTAEDAITPAVEQLYALVDGSLGEIYPATDIAMSAAYDSAEYIQTLSITSPTTMDMSVGFLTKNLAKGLDGAGDILAKNPITGVAGGVLRAAGGLVEGVGTIITDPDKVVKGLGTLVLGYKEGEGFGNWSETGEAWSNLGSALAGGPAWKAAAEAWKKGDYWTAFSEGTAGVGEAGGNVVSFVFTGGAAGAVRGAGLAGRVASMGAKVSGSAARVAGRAVAIAPRTTQFIAGTGRQLARVGRPLSRAGDLALAPLKYGLKPIKFMGKEGAKIDAALTRALTPSKWVKLKPGSKAAEKAANKLMDKAAKYESKIFKLQDQLVDAGAMETAAIRSQIAKHTTKMNSLVREADRLITPVASGSTTPSATWLGWNNRPQVIRSMAKPVPVYMGTPTAIHMDAKKQESLNAGYESRDQQKLDAAVDTALDAQFALDEAMKIEGEAGKKAQAEARENLKEAKKDLSGVEQDILDKLEHHRMKRDERISE